MTPNRDKLAAILWWIFMLIIRLEVATITALAVALWAIPAGIAERGHAAVGGEYLLIIVAWVVGFWASNIFTRKGGDKK
jgi:hypothetical protein